MALGFDVDDPTGLGSLYKGIGAAAKGFFGNSDDSMRNAYYGAIARQRQMEEAKETNRLRAGQYMDPQTWTSGGVPPPRRYGPAFTGGPDILQPPGPVSMPGSGSPLVNTFGAPGGQGQPQPSILQDQVRADAAAGGQAPPVPPPMLPPTPEAPPAPTATTTNGQALPDAGGGGMIHPGSIQQPGGGIKMAPPAQHNGQPAQPMDLSSMIAMGVQAGYTVEATTQMLAQQYLKARNAGAIDQGTYDRSMASLSQQAFIAKRAQDMTLVDTVGPNGPVKRMAGSLDPNAPIPQALPGQFDMLWWMDPQDPSKRVQLRRGQEPPAGYVQAPEGSITTADSQRGQEGVTTRQAERQDQNQRVPVQTATGVVTKKRSEIQPGETELTSDQATKSNERVRVMRKDGSGTEDITLEQARREGRQIIGTQADQLSEEIETYRRMPDGPEKEKKLEDIFRLTQLQTGRTQNPDNPQDQQRVVAMMRQIVRDRYPATANDSVTHPAQLPGMLEDQVYQRVRQIMQKNRGVDERSALIQALDEFNLEPPDRKSTGLFGAGGKGEVLEIPGQNGQPGQKVILVRPRGVGNPTPAVPPPATGAGSPTGGAGGGATTPVPPLPEATSLTEVFNVPTPDQTQAEVARKMRIARGLPAEGLSGFSPTAGQDWRNPPPLSQTGGGRTITPTQQQMGMPDGTVLVDPQNPQLRFVKRGNLLVQE